MNRRDFLKRLGLVVAAPKIFVLPPSGGWDLGAEGMYLPVYDSPGGAYYDNLSIQSISYEHIIPALADLYFKPSPIFWKVVNDAKG